MEVTNILQGFIQKLPKKQIGSQQEEEYIKEMKSNTEIWQLFQEAYKTWEIKDKEEITKKSKLLTEIKKSTHGK
jgi:hypothetical protein